MFWWCWLLIGLAGAVIVVGAVVTVAAFMAAARMEDYNE